DSSTQLPEFTMDGVVPRHISDRAEQKLRSGTTLEVIAVRLPDGGIAVTVEDISDRIDAERKLTEARDKLEVTVAERTQELELSVAELRERSKQQRLLELQLAQEKSRLEITLLAISDGVISTDNSGEIVLLNAAAENMTGWSHAEALGKPSQEIFTLIHETTSAALPDGVAACIASGNTITGNRESVLVSRDGVKRNVFERISPILSSGSSVAGVVIVFNDITDARREEHRVAHAAAHDELTALLNRHALTEAIEDALSRHARYKVPYSLLFVDLDNFKPINDEEGHAAGDAFLKQIAQALKSRARRNDVVGRVGGDEFIVLLESCDLDASIRIANDIRKLIGDCRLQGQDRVHRGSASVGVALVEEHGISREVLQERADQACYAAKRQGGDCVFHWDVKSQRAVQHPLPV
ncbi:MAG: diguanylate cyclase, partial [Pseudomonadota bacterium]